MSGHSPTDELPPLPREQDSQRWLKCQDRINTQNGMPLTTGGSFESGAKQVVEKGKGKTQKLAPSFQLRTKHQLLLELHPLFGIAELLWEKLRELDFLTPTPSFQKSLTKLLFSLSTIGYCSGDNGSFLPSTFWLPDGGCTVKKCQNSSGLQNAFQGPTSKRKSPMYICQNS